MTDQQSSPNSVVPDARQELGWALELIILRRFRENKIDGYTLEMSLELADEAIRRCSAEIAEAKERDGHWARHHADAMSQVVALENARAAAEARLAEAVEVIHWIETWVGQPVGAYSVSALDGLFKLTRDKIMVSLGRVG